MPVAAIWYSWRTDRYRYTEWGGAGAELYDPGGTVNLAARLEQGAGRGAGAAAAGRTAGMRQD